MNNEDGYIFFNARWFKPISLIASEFIVLINLVDTAHDTVPSKFSSYR